MADKPGITPKSAASDWAVQVQRVTVDREAGATLPLAAIALFALVQGIRLGFGAADYLFLLLASIAAGVSMFFFGLLEILKAAGRPKRPWMFIAALGGSLPYLFGLYVFGVRGLWTFVQLRDGFSIDVIVRGVSFTVLGYWFLRSYWRVAAIRAEKLQPTG